MKITFMDKLLKYIPQWDSDSEEDLPDTLVNELRSEEARQALAEAVTALLERWEVHIDNQAGLLGRNDMESILRERQLPDDAELLQRVGHLLAIERALKTLFPYNHQERDRWVWLENAHLGGKIPLELMLLDGLLGIRRVRKFLETEIEYQRVR